MAIEKRKPGRPQKFSKEQLDAIYNEFNEYIEEEEDPTLSKFVSKSEYSLTKDYISSRKEFSDLVKRAIAKQESFLLNQFKNPTLAIFRLKQPQHGYTDKKEVESTALNLNVNADPELANNFLKYLKSTTKQDKRPS